MATYSKLKSGNIRVQIRKRGIAISKTFPLKGLAKDWAARMEGKAYEIDSSGFQQTKITIGALIDLYFKEPLAAKMGRTKHNDLLRLQARMGSTRADSLNEIHINQYVDGRIKAGVAGSTIAGELSFLSGLLKWGRMVKKLAINPDIAKSVRATLPMRGLKTRSEKRDRRPTAKEIKSLYTYWAKRESMNTPMEMLVRFQMVSGMRIGETCRILAEDVNVKKKTVIVRDSKDPKNKEGNHLEMPLLGEAWTITQQQIKGKTAGRIFPYDRRTVSTNFTRACKNLGIKDLRLHDMRHEAISELAEQGWNLPSIAAVSRHRDYASLKRYVNIKAEDLHLQYERKRAL